MSTVIPSTPAEELATPKQVEMLKKNNLYIEGMTKSEASEAIEKLIGGMNENQMDPGLHIMKLKSIESLTDNDGNARTDRRGYPGLKMTFMNPDKKIIEGVFFYDADSEAEQKKKPIDKKCASAFNLINFKKACGFGKEEVSDAEKIKAARFYGVVARQEFVNSSGEIITNEDGSARSEPKLAMRFYPVMKDEKGKKLDPPVIEGDPARNDGECSGIFYTTREIKASSSEPTQTSTDQQQEEAPDTSIEDDTDF